MRIKSGYINGFGKFINYPLEFDKDLFSMCEDNGFGKTTICEFIGAMLYGLPELKSSSKSDNLRGKYAPLGSNVFGGSLVVCDDSGKEYRIEREFSKLGSKDALKMLDEKGNSVEVYKTPGEMLLGLDYDAYSRTLAMHFDGNEGLDNSTISAKLNNLFINSEEDVSIDEALGEIRKELKEYEGKHGLIAKKEAEINSVLKQLDEIETKSKQYSRDYHHYGELNLEIAKLKEKIEKAEIEKEIKRKYDEIELDKKRIAEREAANDEIRRQYGNKFITDEKANKLFELVNIEKGLTRKVDELQSVNRENELRKLMTVFERFSDFESKLAETDYNIREIDKNKAVFISQISDNVPAELSERLIELTQGSMNTEKADKALDIVNDEKKVLEDEISRNTELICQKKKEKEKERSQADYLNELNEWKLKQSKIHNLRNLYIFLFMLFLFSGIGTLIYGLVVPSIMFTIPGAVLLLASFVFVRFIVSASQNNNDYVNKINYITASMQGSFERVNICDRIVSEAELKIDKAESMKTRMNSIIVTLRSIIDCIAKVEVFLELFDDVDINSKSGSYSMLISEIRGKYGKFLELEKYDIENKKAILEASREVAEVQKKINEILLEHGITAKNDVYETVSNIQNVRREVETAQRYIDEDRAKLEEKKKECGFVEKPEYEFLPKILEIEQEKSDKIKELNRLEKTLEELVEDIELKENLEENLSLLYEKKEEYIKEALVLKQTYEFIEKTNEILMDKYYKPVFDEYKELEKAFANDKIVPGMKIRKDYSLSFEIDGKETDSKHLSEGQKLCTQVLLKYAVVKMMFKTDKPFVILDDPFASLDEKNLEDAKKLVKELSKKIQTFYFTCHNIRAI